MELDYRFIFGTVGMIMMIVVPVSFIFDLMIAHRFPFIMSGIAGDFAGFVPLAWMAVGFTLSWLREN